MPKPYGTAARAMVLDYIRSYVQKHGYAPARSEIATALGYSDHSAASYHVRMLAKEGKIRLGRGGRAIALVEQ